MKRKNRNRLIVSMLSFFMAFHLLPLDALAANYAEEAIFEPNGNSIRISADSGENVISVNDNNDNNKLKIVVKDTVQLKSGDHAETTISVFNRSDSAQQFYLEHFQPGHLSQWEYSVDRDVCSPESPMTIEPGQTKDITYSISAKNLADVPYDTPCHGWLDVTAWTRQDDAESFVKDTTEAISLIIEAANNDYYTFTLAPDVTNPEFCLLGKGHSEIERDPVSGIYSFRKTPPMMAAPENYKLLIKYDSGVLVKKLSELPEDSPGNPAAIGTDGCKTIKIDSGKYSKETKIDLITLEKVGSDFLGNHVLFLFRSPPNVLKVSPEIYSLDISAHIGKISIGRRIEDLDVRENEEAIADLSQDVSSYYFNMTDTKSTDWNAKIYYRMGTNWGLESEAGTLFDENSKILKCYTPAQFASEQAEGFVVVIYSDDEMYLSGELPPADSRISNSMSMPLSEVPPDAMELRREDLKEIKFNIAPGQEKPESGFVQLIPFPIEGYAESAEDYFSIQLNGKGDSIYFPAGKTYDLKITVNADPKTTQEIAKRYPAINTDGTREIQVDNISGDDQSIPIRWAGQFDNSGSIEGKLQSGRYISVPAFQSGSSLITEAAGETLDIILGQNSKDYQFYIKRTLNGKEDVFISNSF